MAAQPGDIVNYLGEFRVVTDVAEVLDENMQGVESWAVLRYTDDDPRREVDAEGGDVHFDSAPAEPLEVVGHI
jgi:hypothetical protein